MRSMLAPAVQVDTWTFVPLPPVVGAGTAPTPRGPPNPDRRVSVRDNSSRVAADPHQIGLRIGLRLVGLRPVGVRSGLNT